MRVLVAGDWHSDLHEAEVCKSLLRLGHEVLEFKWFQYFAFESDKSRILSSLFKRLQQKYILGPLIKRINQDFLKQVRYQKPDLIFVYRGTHLYSSTLQVIREELPGCMLVGYNNDDPFSPRQPWYLWRHFIASVPVYDLMLAYRHANLNDLRRVGARKVELLRSWFVPDRNHPLGKNFSENNRYLTDVVFIGHYENDQRLSCLEGLVERGFSLKIYGPGYEWDSIVEKSFFLNELRPINLVWGEEYNKAICGAKIALCFLSKLNRDTYTRRCFEIPATKTLLMSEYTDDLASIFEEDVEAVFFRNKFELLDKVEKLLANPEMIDSIAEAGYNRVTRGGHDIDSRMRNLFNSFKTLEN